ncbi:MAG: hypothetical protein IPP46_02190 [Bacteroidetes bacterium]|nr:hypothetical protein [Bacteroidota bacterium]
MSNINLDGGGDEEFRMMVVEDSSVTSNFIEESKFLSQQQVYKELVHDSILRISNELYNDFVTDKSTSSIGQLHEVALRFIETNLIDSALNIAIVNAREALQSKTDSLFNINHLIVSDTTSYLIYQKENLLEKIKDDKIVISDLVFQLKAQSDAVISSVSALNGSISASGIPDGNEKFINEMYFRYRKEGINVITQEYSNILPVAIQCPSSGGPVVYKARILISLVNDSIEYNDGEVCRLLGIYRMQNVKNDIYINELKIIPNPHKWLCSIGILRINRK